MDSLLKSFLPIFVYIVFSIVISVLFPLVGFGIIAGVFGGVYIVLSVKPVIDRWRLARMEKRLVALHDEEVRLIADIAKRKKEVSGK